MLGKLIKHEWKDTYKVGCIMLLSTFMITIIGYFSLYIPTMFKGQLVLTTTTMVVVMLGFMVLMFGLVGILYGMMIYLGIRFYKNMYGDEGYLTHTLPVTSYQLFISKLFVGGIWLMIIMLAILLAIVILSMSLAKMMSGPTVSLGDIYFELKQVFDSEMAGGFRGYVTYYIVAGILGPFLGMATLYGSVTLGQLFRKHRGIMAIVCYLLVIFVSGVITMLISVTVMVGEIVKIETYGEVNVSVSSTDSYYISMAVTAVIAVILFFVACHIDDKKLNME